MARSRNTGVKTRRKQRGGNSNNSNNNNSNNNTNNYDDYDVRILDNDGESIDTYRVRLYGSPDYDSLLDEIKDYIIEQDYFPEAADEDCIELEYNDDKEGRGFHIRLTCVPQVSLLEDSLRYASRYPQPRVFPPPGNDPIVPERGSPNTNATDPNTNEQSGGRRRKAKRTKAKRTRRGKKHSRRKTKKVTRRQRRRGL